MVSKDATKKAEFRKVVAEQFLQLIDKSEDDYQWQKSWACVNTPYHNLARKPPALIVRMNGFFS